MRLHNDLFAAIEARIAKHEELACRWRDLLSLLAVEATGDLRHDFDAPRSLADAGTASGLKVD